MESSISGETKTLTKEVWRRIAGSKGATECSERWSRLAYIASDDLWRLPSTMCCYDLAGEGQRLGSASIFLSASATWERRVTASKLSLKILHFASDSQIFAFSFFY